MPQLARCPGPASSTQGKASKPTSPTNTLPASSCSTLSTTPSSQAAKAPQDIEGQEFPAQGGHPVRFVHQDGLWRANVLEHIGAFFRVMTLPVVCQGHGDIAVQRHEPCKAILANMYRSASLCLLGKSPMCAS